MSIKKSKNFREISQRISSSGTVDENTLAGLGLENYELVIDLLPRGHKNAVQKERKIVESQGIEYLNISVDFSEPTDSNLKEFSNALESSWGRMVHIHCAANYRVSVFYSIFAVSKGLWSQSQAAEFILSLWDPLKDSVWTEFLARHGLRVSDRVSCDRSAR